MSTAIIPTLPSNRHLDYNKGVGSLTTFITTSMPNILVGVGKPGQEFLTGIPTAPVRPNRNDLRPTPDAQPSTPTTGVSTRSAPPVTTKGGTPSTPAIPKRRYELDEDGDLTKDAYALFDAAEAKYDTAKDAYDKASMIAFTVILSCFHQSTLTVLELDPRFSPIRTQCDCAALHNLLYAVFKQTTIVRSQAAIRALTGTKQGSDTVTTYTSNLRVPLGDFQANYEDLKHPGYVKIDTLAKALFLSGLAPTYQPMLDKIMLGGLSIHDLDLVQLHSDARDYEANIKHMQPDPVKPVKDPKAAGKVPAKNTPNTQHQLLQALIAAAVAQQSNKAAPQALITTTIGHGGVSCKLPARTPELWSTTHPYSRPRGPGTGPGSTAGGPGTYCDHCNKNGWIITDPRHLAKCSDAIRAAEIPAPKALFNGTIDYAVLEAMATLAGLPDQDQPDSTST